MEQNVDAGVDALAKLNSADRTLSPIALQLSHALHPHEGERATNQTVQEILAKRAVLARLPTDLIEQVTEMVRSQMNHDQNNITMLTNGALFEHIMNAELPHRIPREYQRDNLVVENTGVGHEILQYWKTIMATWRFNDLNGRMPDSAMLQVTKEGKISVTGLIEAKSGAGILDETRPNAATVAKAIAHERVQMLGGLRDTLKTVVQTLNLLTKTQLEKQGLIDLSKRKEHGPISIAQDLVQFLFVPKGKGERSYTPQEIQKNNIVVVESIFTPVELARMRESIKEEVTQLVLEKKAFSQLEARARATKALPASPAAASPAAA